MVFLVQKVLQGLGGARPGVEALSAPTMAQLAQSEAAAWDLYRAEKQETASLRAQLAEATKQAETDRQHALRLFRDLHATSEERDALRSQLAEARAAAPRWVPVTERLPEPGVHVLIDLDGDMLIARFFESDWWLDPGGELIGDITHWMPLPGAPAQAEERTKEGSENG